MNKELIKIIKKLSGSVLSIGLDDELNLSLENNDKIEELDEINLISKKKGSIKTNKRIKLKSKKINIKKLKKIYNKKKTNYIICNYEVMKKYMRYFIKDSVYINNKLLYLYGISIKDTKSIIKKYKRYNVLIKPIENKDYFIIEIDNTNSKNNIFKDILYFISDTLELVSDLIGDFLIN